MDWSKSQLQVTFKQLRNFLPEEEEVEYMAVARNAPNTIYVRPCLLATDRRIIYLEPKFIGLSSTPYSYDYSDFADIHLDKGFFTHKLSLTPYPGLGFGAIVVDHLEKRRSEAFYDYVSGRIGRGMDTPDYISRPVFEAPPSPATKAKPKPLAKKRRDEEDPIIKKLTQLKQLHDEGLLTAEEFAKMKSDVLKKL